MNTILRQSDTIFNLAQRQNPSEKLTMRHLFTLFYPIFRRVHN